MNKESKISIAILVIGFFLIALYWFSKNSEPYSLEKERLIFPSETKDIYLNLPKIKSYLDDIEEVIKNGHAILPLQENELDENGKIVQNYLLNNPAFLQGTINLKGEPLHNDMMTIRPAINSVMQPKNQKICQTSTCYEGIRYNFVTNSTVRAIVSIKPLKLLELKAFLDMQPDISLRLRRIAQAIALNAPEIKKELGEKPSIKEMSMANVRGSLNNSSCENKNHLCVAPTFSYHNKEEALWAIVDLTELKLTAAKWAGLGKTSTPACISERVFQNREIMEKYCKKDSQYIQDGWKFRYRITGSDGLEIVDVSFKEKAVLTSAKIVDWHVAYQGKDASPSNQRDDTYLAGRQIEYVKGNHKNFYFGYNDAMGCPMFSTSVVLPFNMPKIKPLIKEGEELGFYLVQDFRNPKWPMACNYRYENRFEFYKDGSFRVVGVNIGRGCGENAIYRPVMRIDMALKDEKFYKYDGVWREWLMEGKDFQEDAKNYAQNKYLYKIENTQGGYYIEPNRGQFHDKSRGDNATLFVTKYKEKEGAQDLLTLGSCCKLDEDGIERYMEQAEHIEGEDIVLWYVPRIQNDAREGAEYCWADTRLENGNLFIKEFPCIVGPMFRPIEKANF